MAQSLGGAYFDLEQEPERLRMDLEWTERLAGTERLVLEQALGELASQGRRFEPYFFRTSDGHEIDLVLDMGSERWAVEVKVTASPTPADMDRLDRTAAMIKASRRFLVSQTPRSSGDSARASCNLVG